MVENNIMYYFQELYTVLSLFFTALHLFKKKKS